MSNEPKVVDQCEHPDCNAVDDHPKFYLIAPVLAADGKSFELGFVTYHHDCAALLGHEKASLVVRHANGAQGDELRSALTDPDHPVHAAVVEHTRAQAEAIAAENKRVLARKKD